MPRPTTLSVQLLITCLMVVRSGGDAIEVARELDINQPSMSKRLKALQSPGPLLARPWLKREGKSWFLTEEGEKVLPSVEELLQRYDHLLRFVEPEEQQPTVAFGCGREFAMTWALQAVTQFRKSYSDPHEEGKSRKPPAVLHIATLRGERRIVRVANGSLDLAVVLHNDKRIKEIARRRLYSVELSSDRLVLVSKEKSTWGKFLDKIPKKGSVDPKTLIEGNLPLILPEPDSSMRKHFDQVLYNQKDEESGTTLLDRIHIAVEIGGWNSVLEYVQNGVGVGIVTDDFLRNSKVGKDLVTRPLDPDFFPPLTKRLIARIANQQTDEPDLTDEAKTFHDVLIELAKQRQK